MEKQQSEQQVETRREQAGKGGERDEGRSRNANLLLAGVFSHVVHVP